MGFGPRKRLGVTTVQAKNVDHVRVYYDKNKYAAHVNRGGLWNFGDGEIAVAHRVKPVSYETGEGVRYPFAHDFSHKPWGDHSGIVLNRSFDNGQTWPEDQKQWIWNNEQSLEEILDWLRPVDPSRRERIDMGHPDAIMHFCPAGEHLKFPFGGAAYDDAGLRSAQAIDPAKSFHLGRMAHLGHGDNPFTFCMRSKDRGRSWEPHVTIIDGPDRGGGAHIVNLGHVRFDSGVLGAVGLTKRADQQVASFFVSHDNGVSWAFLSEVARQSDATDPTYRVTYNGVHRLPDGRLMTCMHRVSGWGGPRRHASAYADSAGNLPCIAFSEDSGLTWSPIRYIVGPDSWNGCLADEKPPRAPGDKDGPWYRSPCAQVTRSGRILVVFARRAAVAGSRGILGVVSDDLGETWSKEFVIRGDQYTWDGGYPLMTEVSDGRFLVAYYFTGREGDRDVPEHACVRYVAGTFFELD